jgi:glycosyltransferase involved in cell wall biosynthesis
MSAVRVLHVLGSMNPGGIESWLMHVMRNIDRSRFQMDFLVHTDKRGAYDEELQALGSRLLPLPMRGRDILQRPWTYVHKFQKILRRYGPHDIIHSHVDGFSGFVLRLAHRNGIPVRIAHSHCVVDGSLNASKQNWLRRYYVSLMKRWVSRYATHGLACSGTAAAFLFGESWQEDPRWRCLYYGIDLDAFRVDVDRAAVRAEFGIPSGALVLGQVGRLVEPRNQAFMLEVAAEALKRRSDAWILLVGDGHMRSAVENKVRALGILDRTVLAGTRLDVARLMVGAMDLFVHPSRCDGVPMVILEAQAAALPCVMSDVVAEEADVAKSLLTRLSLSTPPKVWAEAALRAFIPERGRRRGECLAQMEHSHFNIKVSVEQLAKFYEGCISECSQLARQSARGQKAVHRDAIAK